MAQLSQSLDCFIATSLLQILMDNPYLLINSTFKKMNLYGKRSFTFQNLNYWRTTNTVFRYENKLRTRNLQIIIKTPSIYNLSLHMKLLQAMSSYRVPIVTPFLTIP